MTAVLGLKPGHDGAVAFVVDGSLVFSLEGEKDSFDRYSPTTAQLVVEALREAPVLSDVVAIGGWYKLLPGMPTGVAAGYMGIAPGDLREAPIFGRPALHYESPHERTHLFCGAAMAPFDPHQEQVHLVWEGAIGAFYRWQGPRLPIEKIEVLDQPGARYAALYCIADPSFPDAGELSYGEQSGKLMALAGFADGKAPCQDSIHVVETLMRMRGMYPLDKRRFRRSGLYNCGVTDPEVCRAARYLSDRLFQTFDAAAQRHFEPGLPLVITGGCGLNCDWNSAWRSSGLFSDVFVPPVANDAGSAIGAAMDAYVQLGGECRLEWDVYRGARFVTDAEPTERGWRSRPLDAGELSGCLDAGNVVAWVQGRCEIGPRALGNRSLLASASDPLSHKRLNTIKQREPYRPIAPVCLEEDLGVWFDRDHPDPHMLYFRWVRDRDPIPAVTHVDGSARAQSVTRRANARLYELLLAHRARTEVGVLCNTSLNFSGKGFINRTSELLHYCDLVGIDHVVVEDRWFTR